MSLSGIVHEDLFLPQPETGLGRLPSNVEVISVVNVKSHL